MKYALEIIITIFLFFGICFLYKGQQRVSYNNGQGWDGVFYYKITEQIQQDSSSVKGELPYIRRIGTHFLVGKFARISGMNLLDAAFYINLAGVLLTVMLLLFWLRLYLNIFWIRMLLLLLYMLNWLAPLRYTFFCSMTTDAWGSAWFIGGLLLLHFTRKAYNNKRNLFIYVFLFSIVAAIASLFRESNFILALALFFLPNPFKKNNYSSPEDKQDIWH